MSACLVVTNLKRGHGISVLQYKERRGVIISKYDGRRCAHNGGVSWYNGWQGLSYYNVLYLENGGNEL